jgi:hypothetical protein
MKPRQERHWRFYPFFRCDNRGNLSGWCPCIWHNLMIILKDLPVFIVSEIGMFGSTPSQIFNFGETAQTWKTVVAYTYRRRHNLQSSWAFCPTLFEQKHSYHLFPTRKSWNSKQTLWFLSRAHSAIYCSSLCMWWRKKIVCQRFSWGAALSLTTS